MRKGLRGLSGKMAIASGALAVLLAAVLLVLIIAIAGQRDATREAHASQNVVIASSTLWALVLTLDSGQRGYTQSDSPRYLGPWTKARARLPGAARRLRLLTTGPERPLAVRIANDSVSYLYDYAIPFVRRARREGAPPPSEALLNEGWTRVNRLRGQFGTLNSQLAALAAMRSREASDRADRALAIGIIGIALSTGLILLFALYLSRSVVRPIRRVAMAADGLEAGNLRARVPRRSGGGEVVELGQAFNRMAGSLETQQERLAQKNAELDAQREELAASVERLQRFLRFGRRLAHETEVEPLAQAIVDELASLTDARRAALYAAADGHAAPGPLAARGLDGHVPELPATGPAPRALAARRPGRLTDGDPALLTAGRADGVSDELALPFAHGGAVIGVLVLARDDGARFDEDEAAMAGDLASQAAAPLASALSLRGAREQASVIRAVLDATPDAIALLERRGRTVLENPPMRSVRAAMIESVRAPGGGYRTNVSVQGADPEVEVRDELQLLGTGRTFARYAAPVRDNEGERIGLLIVLREITGEREAERLKDEFFALVSHELRTPLTSIIGYLELVLDDEDDELAEPHRRHLAIVERNATRLLRLVGDLLFVAQVEAGKLALEPSSVDLPQLVAQAVEAARPRAEGNGIELAADVEPMPLCWGDGDRLGQVLDNLISNALKFTPAGGSVTLRLRAHEGAATLEVADTGLGIPAAEQGRLFERFFRASSATSRAIPGVGLGLTIVKAIIEAHGGRVAVSSEEGVGTTFRIDLPLRPPAAERQPDAAGRGAG
jgi:signal transduction histidine kinase